MDTQYSTDKLMDRLYDQLAEHRIRNAKLTVCRPKVSSANRRTFVQNFDTMCEKLNRPVLDVRKFFEAELNAVTTIDGNGNLVITGFFKQNGIEKILSNYIKQYILCSECKSADTTIFKENRITFIKCGRCLSKKAIN